MANDEQLLVDGLGLVITGSPTGTFVLEEFNCPPPKSRAEWISAADSEGASLMRAPQHENREITAKVRIAQQSTMDAALDLIGDLLDKFAKAAQSPDGIVLSWTPATSARTVSFDLLHGEIEDLPVTWNGNDSGWFSRQPVFTIKMTCKPYWYGAEVLAATSSSSTPIVTALVTGVPGDVPALGRLVVTDTATQNRRFVEWGLEPVATSNVVLLDSDNMVVSGFAGATSTVTGAYDANASGVNAITATMLSRPVSVAGTGNLAHTGTWRVRARVQVTITSANPEDAGDTQVRLGYRDGDGPYALNRWVTLPVAKPGIWQEVDLGVISISTALSGAQRWSGRVDAYNLTTTGTFILDYLKFIPTDGGYGKARTVRPVGTAETISAYDEFTATTSGAVLGATTSDSGATWTTAGATTDFTFADSLYGVTREVVTRATTADSGSPLGRSAILGSTNYTNVEVQATSYIIPALGTTYFWGVIARWTDSSNYLVAYWDPNGGGFFLDQVVAGSRTRLASSVIYLPEGYIRVRLLAYASGQAYAYVERWDGATHTGPVELSASTSVLAAGGTLATGKVGFHDFNQSSANGARYYDEFYVGIPPAEQITIASGQSLEVRHDDVIREDAGGTVYGRPSSYRGSRFLVPQEGVDAVDSRVVVHAHRNDLDTVEHTPLGDSLEAKVYYTKRGLVVPR